MTKGTGYFITFEGGEGCGKTTQIALLAAALAAAGHDVIQTREPGGTPRAEAVRDLLSHKDWGGQWTAEAELLLLNAARAEHVHNVIRPALTAGKTVLCDRYIDSTWAYQEGLGGLPQTIIQTLQDFTIGDTMPHLTLLLDLDVETVLSRVGTRGAGDHYDRADAQTHRILRDYFLKRAEENSQRFAVFDAAQDEQALHTQILKTVEEKLSHAV